MILYFVFLVLLILLWLLFVYNLNVDISFTLNSLKIKIFKMSVINLENEKFKKFLVKFIPTSKNQIQEEIDLTSLLGLIHFNVVELKLFVSYQDYPRFILINSIISMAHNYFKSFIDQNIDRYSYIIEESAINNLIGIIKCNFNIGVILINYLIIKGRYKYAKTN